MGGLLRFYPTLIESRYSHSKGAMCPESVQYQKSPWFLEGEYYKRVTQRTVAIINSGSEELTLNGTRSSRLGLTKTKTLIARYIYLTENTTLSSLSCDNKFFVIEPRYIRRPLIRFSITSLVA